MPLQSQSFLPLSGPDNRIFGVIAITPTEFVGDELTFTTQVNSVDVIHPLKRVTYSSTVGQLVTRYLKGVGRVMAPRPMDYMAIALSSSDVRTFYSDKGRLLGYISDYTAWRQPPHAFFKVENKGELLYFMNGVRISPASPVVPTVTGSNIVKSWDLSAGFVNAPTCQFIDINWQQEAAASLAPFQALAVTVGTPTTDPGSGSALRAFVVQSNAAVVGDIVSFSTIRIMKVSPTTDVPTGLYVWPLTLRNQGGDTETVELRLTVI